MNDNYAGLEVSHFAHFGKNPCDSILRLTPKKSCEEIFPKKVMSSFAHRTWSKASRKSTSSYLTPAILTLVEDLKVD